MMWWWRWCGDVGVMGRGGGGGDEEGGGVI